MIVETQPEESPHVRVRVDGPMGSILLRRDEKRNALSRQMIGALQTALNDLHQEFRVRAIVITGVGNAFCAGTDLDEIKETAQTDEAQAAWFRDVSATQTLLEAMIRFPKPIISAVNGPALGTGLGLVLASDIVIGCAEAEYGVPEPRRGLVASLIAPLLSFRIGGGAAASMLLRAQTLSGDDAMRIGLVHEQVIAEQLWARAAEITGEIAESASEAITLTKRNLYEGVGEKLATLMSVGAAATATARTTDAAVEGVNAFVDKRPPDWP